MPLLKVAFFTEAGSTRGMGHLMRCYAIYEYFKKNNHTVKFFLDSDVNYNYKFEKINYFTWCNFFIDQKYDIIFIDSYLADIKVYEMISAEANIAVFIDDYARLNYPKGTILNFAPKAMDFFKNKLPYHIYLLGLKYLPLRKQLNDIKTNKRNQIFISLGGSDIKNYSYEVIDTLQYIGLPLIITVNDYDMANKIALCHNTHIIFRPSDEELIISMQESSMAISTASMTLYELAYLNIPSIIIAASKSQTIGANQLIQYKLAYALLDMESTKWKTTLKNYVNALSNKPFDMDKKLIDGKGVERIYNTIKDLLC